MDGTQRQPNPSAMFSLRRGQKTVLEPLDADENTTAWEVYNSRALMIDRELVKDWNDSLNTLLIFVSTPLFSYACYKLNLSSRLLFILQFSPPS